MRFTTNNQNLSREEAERLLTNPKGKLSVDIETVSLDNTTPVGIGVATDRDTGFYFFNPADEMLKDAVRNTETLVLHNAAFDIPIMERYGYVIPPWEDTMMKAYSAGLLDKSLEVLSPFVLGRDNPSISSIWDVSVYNRSKKKSEQANIGVDHTGIARLCITHACNTLALWEDVPLTELYTDIDRPCVDLVIEMERNGILIDQYKLTEVEQEVVVKAAEMERQLKEELGELNLFSSQQVAKALQERGIIGTRKTGTGRDSVSEESLKPLDHPLTNLLLAWRKEAKTITTYLPAFRRTDQFGRLHTTFGYTTTGRWSSSKPNLQNITNSDLEHEWGLRDCVIAPQGYTFLSLDASQIELRVVAILSGDPLLLQAITEEDLHLATAIQVFGWTDDPELMAKRRYDAKQLNFAILYGADEYKVAEMAGCSLVEASMLISQYFMVYRRLEEWIEETKAFAHEHEYVLNLFNRKRPFPDINSPSLSVREAAEREAVNMIVQGTAVDIVKKAMLYLKSIINPDVRLVLQVHDEILFEVPDELLGDTIEKSRELELAFPDYPFIAKTGTIYGRLEKV